MEAKVKLYERATSLILILIEDNPEKEWSVEKIWKELNSKAESGIEEYQILFNPHNDHSIPISTEDVKFILCRLIQLNLVPRYIWKSLFDFPPKHFLQMP